VSATEAYHQKKAIEAKTRPTRIAITQDVIESRYGSPRKVSASFPPTPRPMMNPRIGSTIRKTR
jgi:hypothetical protein